MTLITGGPDLSGFLTTCRWVKEALQLYQVPALSSGSCREDSFVLTKGLVLAGPFIGCGCGLILPWAVRSHLQATSAQQQWDPLTSAARRRHIMVSSTPTTPKHLVLKYFSGVRQRRLDNKKAVIHTPTAIEKLCWLWSQPLAFLPWLENGHWAGDFTLTFTGPVASHCKCCPLTL